MLREDNLVFNVLDHALVGALEHNRVFRLIAGHQVDKCHCGFRRPPPHVVEATTPRITKNTRNPSLDVALRELDNLNSRFFVFLIDVSL